MSSILSAQGFQDPKEGKAVVYIVRVTNEGGPEAFKFFHNDKYIGAFRGKDYVRYECDPGEHLFWVSFDNKFFITADFEEGGVYLIQVDIDKIKASYTGSERVKLIPLTFYNVDIFARAKKMIKGKAPSYTSKSDIDEMNKELSGFITETLLLYEGEWKHEIFYDHISADMATPPDELK